MLVRSDPTTRAAGWLLTLGGLVALAVGGRGYLTGAPVRPGWVLGGMIAIVAGSAVLRWVRRAE